jgi:transcriptional regulator
MYLPAHFEENDRQRILTLVERYGFATLVTTGDEGPFASHLPLMLEDRQGFVLSGHMARANRQWRHFQGGREVLAIFHGPHAYVSPTHYASPGVPTWNYAVVHMYGKAEIIEDEEQLKQLLETLTHKYEQTASSPWAPDYPDKLLSAIVGFQISVDRMQAKSKLSQNRPAQDRSNIIDGLSSAESDNARALAALMRANDG